jgi:hypothetical protein
MILRLFLRSCVALCVCALLLPLSAQAKSGKGKRYNVKAKATLEAGKALDVTFTGTLETCSNWDCFLWVGELHQKPTHLIELDGDGNWIAWSREEEEEEEEDEDKDDKKKGDEEEEAVYLTGETGQQVRVKEAPEELCDGIVLYKPKEKDDEKSKGKKPDAKDPESDDKEAESDSQDAEPEGKDGDSSATDEGGDAAVADAKDDAAAADAKDESWRDLPVLTTAQRKECERKNSRVGKYTVEAHRGSLTAMGDERLLSLPSSLLPEGKFQVSSNGRWGAIVEGTEIGDPEKTGVIQVRR